MKPTASELLEGTSNGPWTKTCDDPAIPSSREKAEPQIRDKNRPGVAQHASAERPEKWCFDI